MKSILACALLLSICVTEARSQDPRQESRRPFGRPEIKQRAPAPPPVPTTLITMTGQHVYPDPTRLSELTLLVPVQLGRLDPAITHARVNCEVDYEPSGVNNPLAVVGRGVSEEILIVKGALADTLPVPLIAVPGKNLSAARDYYCFLALKVNDTWLPPYNFLEIHPVDPSQPLKFAASDLLPYPR